MKKLLDDPGKAMQLGRGAKETALEKFNIERFVYDWMKVFEKMTNRVLYTSAIPGNSNIWTGTE